MERLAKREHPTSSSRTKRFESLFLPLGPRTKVVEKHARWYYGGIAAACATCFTHPLDLIKVLVQTHEPTKAEGKFRIFPVVKSLIRRDGITILFTGLSASILRQLTYSTTRFAVYDIVKNRKYAGPADKLPYWDKLQLSAVAGATGGVVGAPADLVNVRMQNDAKLPKHARRQYKNGVHGIYKIICDEGAKTLFNGLSWITIRSVIMTVGQLSFYDQTKETLIGLPGIRVMLPHTLLPVDKDGLYHFHDDVVTHVASSACAALLTTSLSQPVDVLKTRVQNSTNKHYGMLEIIRLTVKQDGLRGFFKGFWPRFVRLGPNTVLLFVFYEQLRHRFGIPTVAAAPGPLSPAAAHTKLEHDLKVMKTDFNQLVTFSASADHNDKNALLSSDSQTTRNRL